MKKNKNSNKKVLLTVLLLILLISIITGMSYAIFIWSREGKVNNVISTRAIKCNFSEGPAISIKSAFPISDEVGKTLTSDSYSGYDQGYYDSTLSCKCKGTCKGTYEIYAINNSTEPKLNAQYVKTYVTDGEATERELTGVKRFSDLETAQSDPSGVVIYKGTFSGSFSQKIRLRMWLADDYDISDDSKIFKARLNANISEN